VHKKPAKNSAESLCLFWKVSVDYWEKGLHNCTEKLQWRILGKSGGSYEEGVFGITGWPYI
jgi:hypothetical protein